MNSTPSLLEALVAILTPIVKDAVAEALRDQKPQELPIYPEKVGIKQAAEITRYSVNSLHQMHHNKTIPGAIKVGGKLLFDTATLRKWVENGGTV